MTKLYRDHAVVLRTIKLGEADRIVTLLTAGNGKVRAVAKGARKTSSRFGARLEPGRHISVQLHRGRGDLDIVTQVESVDHFANLRADFDRLGRAAAVLEAVDLLAPDREGDVRLYQMLVGALRTLDQRPAPALVGAFFLKMLGAEGLAPVLECCVGCGAGGEGDATPLVAFDPAGGAQCRTCRTGQPMSDGALALMRRVVGGDLSGVLDEADSAPVHEMETLATSAVEAVLERRLKAGRSLRVS